MKKFKKLMLVGMMALVLIGVQATSYALTIAWIDGTNRIGGFLMDNQTGDLDPRAGFITWAGTLNNNWSINLTGTSNSIVSPNDPQMGLVAQFSSVGGGWLAFGVVDSGFAGPMVGNSFDLNVWGATGGTVMRSFAFGDTLNRGIFNGTTFDNLGPLAGAFSGTASGSFGSFSFGSTTPFTLGIAGYIYHQGSATTNFNASLVDPTTAPVPEPSVILLLGSGLIGMWGFRKKFKK